MKKAYFYNFSEFTRSPTRGRGLARTGRRGRSPAPSRGRVFGEEAFYDDMNRMMGLEESDDEADDADDEMDDGFGLSASMMTGEFYFRDLFMNGGTVLQPN